MFSIYFWWLRQLSKYFEWSIVYFDVFLDYLFGLWSEFFFCCFLQFSCGDHTIFSLDLTLIPFDQKTFWVDSLCNTEKEVNMKQKH